MNLSQLLGTIFRGTEPTHGQLLQLKPGQIVKATILAMISNEEALLQIGQTKLIGKLEASLTVGETAWLQVKQRVATGQITMKVVNAPNSGKDISNGSFEQLTLALGLSNNPKHQQIVQTLVDAGVPLSKEKTQQIEQIVNELVPKGIREKSQFTSTLDAIVIAVKRQLPLSQMTIRSIREFISSEPLDEKLNALIKEIDTQLQTRSNIPSPTLATKISHIRNEIEKLYIQQSSVSPIQIKANENAKDIPTRTQHSAIPSIGLSQVMPHTGETVDSPIGHSIQRNDVNAQIIRNTNVFPSTNRSESPERETDNNKSNNKPNDVQVMLNRMGISHENTIKELMKHNLSLNESVNLETNNVKSMLISLISDELHQTPLLRELAEKMVNHITGQQLMMLQTTQPDSVFSQLIWQIPVHHQGQTNTAFIQMEWKNERASGKKEIDLANCRIFFQLTMTHLGLTLVDVNIVDKIVNLKIYNNDPGLNGALSPLIKTLEKNMDGLGYRFSGVTYAPIQMKTEIKQSKTYQSSSYKGVDLRI